MHFYIRLEKGDDHWVIKLDGKMLMSQIAECAHTYRQEGFTVKLYSPAWRFAHGR